MLKTRGLAPPRHGDRSSILHVVPSFQGHLYVFMISFSKASPACASKDDFIVIVILCDCQQPPLARRRRRRRRARLAAGQRPTGDT